jgi:hypothetical protein
MVMYVHICQKVQDKGAEQRLISLVLSIAGNCQDAMSIREKAQTVSSSLLLRPKGVELLCRQCGEGIALLDEDKVPCAGVCLPQAALQVAPVRHSA